MKNQPVERDERTVSVENASYRIAYLVVSFGLLISVIYRSLALRDSSWDLLALVVIGGFAGTMYQGIHRILSRRSALAALTTAFFAVALAVIIALARR